MEQSTLKNIAALPLNIWNLFFPNNVPILRQIPIQVLRHAAPNCINSKQIIRYQDALAAAINSDFSSRSLDESKLLDLLGSVLEADHAIHHLRRWMRPSKRRTELLFLSNRLSVQYQPKGVVGVIVPGTSRLFSTWPTLPP